MGDVIPCNKVEVQNQNHAADDFLKVLVCKKYYFTLNTSSYFAPPRLGFALLTLMGLQKYRRLGSTGRCLEDVTVKILLGGEEMPDGQVR